MLQWPKLSSEQQADYQLRASELLSLANPPAAVVPDTPSQPIYNPSPPPLPPPVTTTATPTYTRSSYMCHWDGCGLQFADVAGLFAHVTNLGPGTHIKREGKNWTHQVLYSLIE